MRPLCSQQRRRPALYFFIVVVALLLSSSLTAQTRRSASSKKPTAKKSERSAKDARKEKASARGRDNKKNKREDRAASKRSKQDDRAASRKERDSERKTAAKKSRRETAEERRQAAARRREEAERRAAALAERRRREQAAREARARKLAFERGLREETVSNIAKDSIEGEDLTIRRAAVSALGKHAGTVVVMEAQTGKIVTMVNQDWAIREGFKPCSTIKLVTGVAGLSEELINKEGNITTSNFRMDLQDALAYSNNVYFQRVGTNLGNSKMIAYAKNLGLGEPTGINAEGESAGKLPYGNSNPRIYSHGDDFEVTPLQLAVMVSAISNGGKRVVPQIAKTRFESTSFRGRHRASVTVPQNDLRGVIPGMVGAASYGTARRGVDASMGVAGKTGSCISKGSWVGLFASVAPIEDPKYSVVVITRGQSERGKYAAAIAGRVYSALRTRLTRPANNMDLVAPVKPRIPIDSRTADMDEGEEDDTEFGDSDTSAAADLNEDRVTPAAPIKAPIRTAAADMPERKLVTKTVQSNPVNFPPVIIEYKKDGSTRPRIVKNK
jgi:hypothetical protein